VHRVKGGRACGLVQRFREATGAVRYRLRVEHWGGQVHRGRCGGAAEGRHGRLPDDDRAARMSPTVTDIDLSAVTGSDPRRRVGLTSKLAEVRDAFSNRGYPLGAG
jgi:hypothetical protein